MVNVCWDLSEQEETEEDRRIKRLLESLPPQENFADGSLVEKFHALMQEEEEREGILPVSDGPVSSHNGLRDLLVKDKVAGLERLIAQYGKLFYKIGWGVLYNYDLAQDAVSEAYIKIYDWLAGAEPREIMKIDLLPYLCRIVLNVSLTCLKREKRQRLRWDRKGQEFFIEQRLRLTIDEFLEREEEFRILHEEVNRLPTKYRRAIQLRHLLDGEILGGLSEVDSERYTQLAAFTGINEATLRSQVHRGLKLLKKRLSARGIGGSTMTKAT